MKEPFDIEYNGLDYAIFPEEDDIFTIFRDGKEHMKIQRDSLNSWIKLDPETELPRFEADEEVNGLGREIVATLG